MSMYVNHFTVQQILTPHRKSTILCLKKKIQLWEKRPTIPHPHPQTPLAKVVRTELRPD